MIGRHKTKRHMFSMALMNSSSGLPISLLLNILVAIPLVLFLDSLGVPPVYNALALSVPFFLASVGRIYIFAWIEDRYQINIRPEKLLKDIFDRINHDSI